MNAGGQKKSKAAILIFVSFDDPTANAFVNLLTCLSIIHDSDKFYTKTKQTSSFITFKYVWVFHNPRR